MLLQREFVNKKKETQNTASQTIIPKKKTIKMQLIQKLNYSRKHQNIRRIMYLKSNKLRCIFIFC